MASESKRGRGKVIVKQDFRINTILVNTGKEKLEMGARKESKEKDL